MPVNLQALARARRDRCVAQILRYAEHDSGIVWHDEWDDFRANVLGAVNAYHDSVLDMLRSIEQA